LLFEDNKFFANMAISYDKSNKIIIRRSIFRNECNFLED